MHPLKADCTVLVLYSEFMPYNLVAFRQLATEIKGKVYVVCWDRNKLTPYFPVSENDIFFIKRSEVGYKILIELFKKIDPNMVFVSGWMDALYLRISRFARKRNTLVVLGLDNHWNGSLKQIILRYFFLSVREKLFSHAFVPGTKQLAFALKLGFAPTHIITGAYTADSRLFTKVNSSYDKHRILFIGRLTEIKGIGLLVKAFLKVTKKANFSNWTLTIVGDGEDKIVLPINERIAYKGFLSQEEMLDILKSVSFFCLPSLGEPWGLVVHEMAAAGLPLLISNVCGSAEDFLIDDYNGYSFDHNVFGDLEQKLEKMMSLNLDQLKLMGERSRALSSRNSPQVWSKKLAGLLDKDEG